MDPPFLAANNKRKSTQVNKPMLELSESSDEEVDGNNSIFESNDNEDNNLLDIGTVSVRLKFYAQGAGGVEMILNLREWMISPWTDKE